MHTVQVHHADLAKHREPGLSTLNLVGSFGDLGVRADAIPPEQIIVVGRTSDQVFVWTHVQVDDGASTAFIYAPVDPALMLRVQLLIFNDTVPDIPSP